MPDLKSSRTLANLKAAFAVESQAQLRHRYFAVIADFEGQADVAQILAEVAESDANSAEGHLDFLKQAGDPRTDLPVGETADNLTAAIAAGREEADALYPRMAQVARDEGLADIADWFETLAKAKRAHAARFQAALDALK